MGDVTEAGAAPVKIGMVGVGYIGQIAHLANYDGMAGCEVTAVADIRPGLRDAVQAHYGIPQAYATHRELLDNSGVDAVVAVTRRHHVGPVALDCLRAGKHLLTEKPMAATLQQAEKLVAAAETSGAHYAIGYMKRHDEGVQLARGLIEDLVASGELGPLTFARFYCFQGHHFYDRATAVGLGEDRPEDLESWAVAPDWLPPELHDGYDNFMNVFAHDINLMRYLLGATPKASHLDYRSQAGSVALFDCGDFPAAFEFGMYEHDNWCEGVEIFFQRGHMTIELPPPLLKNVPARVTLHRAESGDQVETFEVGQGWSFQRQAQAFIDDLREDRESIVGGRDSLEDLRVIEELWKRLAT
ncbi:MAG: Gfo/Idh/MocA family oxidoreductase [Alphaproteobacteria bacterium]|nr:Gfo/Idh/MocA family oxidoreductase [Alphaproteobacteria bacterium]